MPRRPLKLSRRALLRGAGGAVVALPLLEAMLDAVPARAQTVFVPKRYLVLFGGHSICGAGNTATDYVVPKITGTGYELTPALQPLAAVQSEVSVISNLKIPTAYDNGGTIPAGGKPNSFHISSLSPLLTGVRSTGNGATGVSSDTVAADFLAGSTTFRQLVLRVQASNYVNSGGGGPSISYKKSSTGSIQEILPTVSPQQAFQSLFGNFTAGLSPSELAQQQFLQTSRLSVIDRVARRAQALRARLGVSDQQRLDLHLEEVRQLEQRVQAVPPTVQGICQKPADPGADPPIGGGQGTDSGGNITYTQNLGYSDEATRAKVMCDLIHMALACDLTRVVALQLTMFQSFLNMYPLIGQRSDMHELSHGGFGNLTENSNLALAQGIGWHYQQFGYLVDKFKNTPEAGGTMLDNLAMAYVCEGGHGYDPSSGNASSAHSTDSMVALLAGRAGGLRPGQHIDAQGAHPAQVLLTGLRAVGYSSGTLGEVSGEIPGLRG